MASAIVVGSAGRMGRLLMQALLESGDFDAVREVDAGNVGELDTEAPAADLVVDFSHPSAVPHVAAYVRRTGAALVCGTTGLGEEELATLRDLGKEAPVVWSGNYSLGVAALRHATHLVSEALPGWDAEIVETHHNLKADAPSGTAKMLVAEVDPTGERPVVYGREGMVGARPAGEIGVHALRGGTVAGTHEVHFFGTDEEVCLTHRAASRQIFVTGAVAAAHRLLAKPAGFYTFDDLMFGA